MQQAFGHPEQPTVAESRLALERILADPAMGNPRRRALLRYLVEQALAGRADRLKGYAIAIDVFGRDAGFDPQADPVVRLEARRLRRDLDGYYARRGAEDPVRISIPKGGYAPLFEAGAGVEKAEAPVSVPATPAAGARRPLARRFMLGGLAAFVLVGLAGAWTWAGRPAPPAEVPAVMVLPLQALGDAEDDRYLAAGLTQELVTDLLRFDAFRLYSVSPFGGDPQADPLALGRDLAVAYVVRGALRSEAAEVRVGAQLVDATSGEVVWSETYDRPMTPEALLGVQTDIAARIATQLGQPYGVLSSDAARRLLGDAAPSMPSYSCVLRAYVYRRTFRTDLYAPTLACLKQSVRRDRAYAAAWALLGWLEMDAARFDYVAEADKPAAFDRALAAAGRAVELDSENVLALQALSSINYYAGRYAEAERLQRRALALNPNDPDTLAQLGWRLSARGQWDDGIPLLRQAIERTVSPPGWYYHLIVVDEYLRGEYAAALADARLAMADDSGISWSFLAITEAANGDMVAAGRALDEMAKRAPLLARDPAAAYRRHQATDEIVESLVAGLRAAGWSEGRWSGPSGASPQARW